MKVEHNRIRVIIGDIHKDSYHYFADNNRLLGKEVIPIDLKEDEVHPGWSRGNMFIKDWRGLSKVALYFWGVRLEYVEVGK